MRITLLRHGKPSVDLSGSARANELGIIAKAYEGCGIVDQPPPATLAALQHHTIVICSDLPRSVESALALGFSEIHSAQALFREAALPYFTSGSIALPLSVWLTILRVFWLAGFTKNGEAYVDARLRARIAAAELISLAEQHDNVLLVGHGVINYLIAKQLLANGWLGPAKLNKQYWAFDVFES